MSLKILSSTEPSGYASEQLNKVLLRNTTTSIFLSPPRTGMTNIDYSGMKLTGEEIAKIKSGTDDSQKFSI